MYYQTLSFASGKLDISRPTIQADFLFGSSSPNIVIGLLG